MFQVIEAPNYFPTPTLLTPPMLFLAGSITDCPDWQQDVIKKIKALKIPLTVLNPRRANFPIHDSAAANQQITWEFEGLQASTMISFWFSKESLGPIVLYELGSHLRRFSEGAERYNARIVIGIDPAYKRRQDVEIQTRLLRPGTPIVYDLDCLVQEVNRMTSRWRPLTTPLQTKKSEA